MNKKNSKITCINNSIDANKYIYNEVVDNKLRQKYNLKNELVIAQVGRFTKQKNYSKLIKIFNSICNLEPNSKLLLIGKGELEQLEQQIMEKVKSMRLESKVLYLGEISNVSEILQMVDAFVFPSLYEF